MANPIIGTLTTEVNETIGVVKSAVVVLNGVQSRIDAAVAAAIANGATEAELAPFTDLSAALDSETNALANAVAAHPTPGGEPPVEPPPVEPSARRRG